MYINTFDYSVFKCLADITMMEQTKSTNPALYMVYTDPKKVKDDEIGLLGYCMRRYSDILSLWNIINNDQIGITMSAYGEITVIISDIILNALWDAVYEYSVNHKNKYAIYGIPKEVVEEVDSIAHDSSKFNEIQNEMYNCTESYQSIFLSDDTHGIGYDRNRKDIFMWLLHPSNTSYEVIPVPNDKMRKKFRFKDSLLYGYYTQTLAYALNNRTPNLVRELVDNNDNTVAVMSNKRSLDFSYVMKELVNSMRKDQKQLSRKSLAEIAASKPVISDGLFNRLKKSNSSISDDTNIKSDATNKFIEYAKKINLISNSNLNSYTDVQGILGSKMETFKGEYTYGLGSLSLAQNTERTNGKGDKFDIKDKQAEIIIKDDKARGNLEEDISEVLERVEILNRSLFYKKNYGNVVTVFEWFAQKVAEKEMKELHKIFSNNSNVDVRSNITFAITDTTGDSDKSLYTIGAATFVSKIKNGLKMLDDAYDVYCNVGVSELKFAQQKLSRNIINSNNVNYLIHGEDYFEYKDKFDIDSFKSNLFKNDDRSKYAVISALNEIKPGEVILTSSGVDKINNILITFGCLEKLEKSLRSNGYHIYDLPLKELVTQRSMQRSLRGLLHLNNSKPTPKQLARLETRWNTFTEIYNVEDNISDTGIGFVSNDSKNENIRLTNMRNNPAQFLFDNKTKNITEPFEISLLNMLNHKQEDVYYIVIDKIMQLAFPKSVGVGFVNVKLFNTKTEMLYRSHPRLEFYTNCTVKNMKIILGLLLMLYRYSNSISNNYISPSYFAKNVSRYFRNSGNRSTNFENIDYKEKHITFLEHFITYGQSIHMHKFTTSREYNNIFSKNYSFLPSLVDCINRGDEYLFKQAAYYVDIIGGCCSYYTCCKENGYSNAVDVADYLNSTSNPVSSKTISNYCENYIRFDFVAFNQAMKYDNCVYVYDLYDVFSNADSKPKTNIENPILGIYRAAKHMNIVNSNSLASIETNSLCYCKDFHLFGDACFNRIKEYRETLYNVNIEDFATVICNPKLLQTGNTNTEYANNNSKIDGTGYFPNIKEMPENINVIPWDEMFDRNYNNELPCRTSYDREQLYERFTYLTYEVFSMLFMCEDYRTGDIQEEKYRKTFTPAIYSNKYNNFTITPKFLCDLVFGLLDAVSYTTDYKDRVSTNEIADGVYKPSVLTGSNEKDFILDITKWEHQINIVDSYNELCDLKGKQIADRGYVWSLLGLYKNILNSPSGINIVLSDDYIDRINPNYTAYLNDLSDESVKWLKSNHLDGIRGAFSYILEKSLNTLTNQDITIYIRNTPLDIIHSDFEEIYSNCYLKAKVIKTMSMFQEEYNPFGLVDTSSIQSVVYPADYYYSALTEDQISRHGGEYLISCEAEEKPAFFSTLSPTFGLGFAIFANYARSRSFKVNILTDFYPIAKCASLIRDEYLRMGTRSGETHLDTYALTNLLYTYYDSDYIDKAYLKIAPIRYAIDTVKHVITPSTRRYNKTKHINYIKNYNSEIFKLFNNNVKTDDKKYPFVQITDYYSETSESDETAVIDNKTAIELSYKLKQFIVECTVNTADNIYSQIRLPIYSINSNLKGYAEEYAQRNPLNLENKGLFTDESDIIIRNIHDKQNQYQIDKYYIEKFFKEFSDSLKLFTIMQTSTTVTKVEYKGKRNDLNLRLDNLGNVKMDLIDESVGSDGNYATITYRRYIHAEGYYITVCEKHDEPNKVVVSVDTYGMRYTGIYDSNSN